MNATSKPPESKTISQSQQVPLLLLLNEEEHTDVVISTNLPTDSSKQKTSSSPVDTLAAMLDSFTLGEEYNEEENAQPEVTSEPITQCYTAGPFENSDLLQQAASFLKNFDIEFEQRASLEKQYIGQLVYLPSHESRKQVIDVAEALAAKGVRDYMLLNEAGKTHALSLGVFGLKKNAEARIQTLAKLNYKALSEPRYKTKTIHWLDYTIKDENSKAALAAEQMQILNASQIERNCKS